MGKPNEDGNPYGNTDSVLQSPLADNLDGIGRQIGTHIKGRKTPNRKNTTMDNLGVMFTPAMLWAVSRVKVK